MTSKKWHAIPKKKNDNKMVPTTTKATCPKSGYIQVN